MALKKFVFTVEAAYARKRLDQFLAEQLPEKLGQPVSKGKVRKLVVAGAVYLNGKRVRIASKELIPGALVGVYVDSEKLFGDERAKDVAFEMTQERVLFEDDFLIVVDKPAGLPTQATLDEARDHLVAAVKRFLAQRDGRNDGKPEPYLALHHRLDRDTSGVVLFAKAREANAGVADLFSKHRAQKIYQALTHRGVRETLRDSDVPLEWTVENHLGPERSRGKRARYTAVRSGGDYAKTEFRTLEIFPDAIWVEARPLTGRTHQIRVHLSESGMPILGDTHYGAAQGGAPRVMLHAASLTFPHPITKVTVTVQSQLPEDFRKCLQAYKSPKKS